MSAENREGVNHLHFFEEREERNQTAKCRPPLPLYDPAANVLAPATTSVMSSRSRRLLPPPPLPPVAIPAASVKTVVIVLAMKTSAISSWRGARTDEIADRRF